MSFDSAPQWHVMAKPATWQGRAMHGHEWTCRKRGIDLLHATLLPLGSFGGLGCDMETLLWALSQVEGEPFIMVLDRARGTDGGTAELNGSRSKPAAQRFRRALRASLERGGVTVTCKSTIRPHVTLNYQWREPSFEQAITPIAWLIDEFLLVESLTGKARHVVHGRFPIRPRQGMLFPLIPCAPAGAAAA